MAHASQNGTQTSQTVTHDLWAGTGRAGGFFWFALVVSGGLAVVGLVALLSLANGGPRPTSSWGYPAATVAFVLSTFQGGPVVAFATRLAKGLWALPLRRAAELGALAGLVNAPLYIFVLLQLPDFRGRPSIWFFPNALSEWPGAPVLWDSIAMLLLTFTGLVLLWLSCRADLAAKSGATGGGPRFGWWGTDRQWNVLSAGVVILGAFYLMVLVFVHVFTISDLAISLVPGWRSAIMPPYHGVSGLQGGLASVILIAGALRRFGGLDRYIGLDVFWGASKILLGLSLLFFYFTWAELLTNWYGRTLDEQFLQDLLMFGPYLWLFIFSFSFNFVLPLGLLIWNPIRVSIRGPIAVAAIIFVGNLIDRVRIYVASWSVAGPVALHPPVPPLVPPTQYPTGIDALIFLGTLGAIGFLYLLALRVIPAISLWEYKSLLLFVVERRYAKAEVRVVAKPR